MRLSQAPLAGDRQAPIPRHALPPDIPTPARLLARRGSTDPRPVPNQAPFADTSCPPTSQPLPTFWLAGHRQLPVPCAHGLVRIDSQFKMGGTEPRLKGRPFRLECPYQVRWNMISYE